MTEFERRIWQQFHSLLDGFSKWWTSMRDTDAAKRATSAMHDLKESDAAKRAATTFSDLRDTDAAKRAASTLADLRQRPRLRRQHQRVLTEYSVALSGPGWDSTCATDRCWP